MISKEVNPYSHLNSFYRPGLSFARQLLETTVGRRSILDKILERLEEEKSNPNRKNLMITGVSGVGKTHFIKILGETVQKSLHFNNLYTVIQFPEENHRVLTFADLLLAIVEILSNISGKKQWQKLYNDLEEVGDEAAITAEVISRLESYCDNTNTSLLILLENIDLFFKGQLRDDKNIKEFKKFLSNTSLVTFIGTSQHDMLKTEELKRSPYNLFEVIVLEVLSENQTIDLIKKNLEWDKRDDLLKTQEDLILRIKALYQMSGGNPRLSLILYELIAKENKWDIKRQIEKLLDQTSPFFRDRLRSMAPLESALLETIALLKLDSKTPAFIAKKLRISPQQASNLLNKLLKAGFLIVTDHPTDKRSKIYRIKEGFFGLWLAIGHSRQQNIILPHLVEFLEQWYAENQGRERKRQQIWQSLNNLNIGDDTHVVNNQEQLLNYLTDIGSLEEKAQNKLELTCYFLTKGKTKEAKRLLMEIDSLSFKKPYYFRWIIDQCRLWIKEEIEPVVLQQIEDIINCWKLQKADDSDRLVQLALKLTTSLWNNESFDVICSFLKDVYQAVHENQWQILLLEKIAVCQEQLKKWEDALNTWNRILVLADETEDLKTQGTILNNISQIHQDRNDYDTALKYLRISLTKLQKIEDYEGQGTTLNNISTIHFAQGYYEKALERLEQALSVIRKINNPSLEGITLSNISLIYQERGDNEKALEYLKCSLKNMERSSNRFAQSTTLNNISQIYLELGSPDKSIEYVNKALSIMEEDKNPTGISLSLYNRGKIYWKTDFKDQAILDWLLSYKLAEEYDFREIITRFEQLANSFGEDGLNYWKIKLEDYMEQKNNELKAGA